MFGQSVDDEKKLARTMLTVMIRLMGGPDFIYKSLPMSGLTSDFLCRLGTEIINIVYSRKDSEVLAIVADGHRTNQRCFDILSKDSPKPWFYKNTNTFLLYDFVHIMKCIRNNWLTEPTQELLYTFQGVTQVAKWSDLKLLLKAEENSLIKQSKLNSVAVFPKPIERQKVETCLRIFSDETISALENHPNIDSSSMQGTINFLKIINKFWKIANVRTPNEDIKFNDSNRAVIRSMDDKRIIIAFLKDFAEMATKMSSKGTKRVKSFTADTAKFINHTCLAFIDLAEYLLNSGYKYVMFGLFSTDKLEKKF